MQFEISLNYDTDNIPTILDFLQKSGATETLHEETPTAAYEVPPGRRHAVPTDRTLTHIRSKWRVDIASLEELRTLALNNGGGVHLIFGGWEARQAPPGWKFPDGKTHDFKAYDIPGLTFNPDYL